jgi:hypothetical protein
LHPKKNNPAQPFGKGCHGSVPILFGFLDPLAPFLFYLKKIKNVYFLSFLLKTLKKSKFFSLIGFFDRTTYVGCGEGVGQFM